MSKDADLAERLRSLFQPHFGRARAVDLDARVAADLGIRGSDYLELKADLESTFQVDLHDFLVGPDPEYVSTGFIGWLAGEPRKPVYRDVSVREILDFLESA